MTVNCGTTIFGISTRNGITIGADSMARHPDGHTEIFRKLHVVRRCVIACEGLGVLQCARQADRLRHRFVSSGSMDDLRN